MATGKKYFWIKLKTDFMTSDKVDYLMSQTNGAEYVVLYQMLCMKCINTDGLLARQIGEVIIPFDVEKIARDCKYFSIDTVKQAFQLFIQLGMIYQESNGYLRIADFENMVGSETDWAAQKRKQVKSKENINIECGNTMETSVENLHTDIDIRDRVKILDINNIYAEKSAKKTKKEPLRNRDPENDYEKIEKTYIQLWDSLFHQKKVNTANPIVTDWKVIRNLEKGLLQSIPVAVIQNAIINSVNNNFVVQNGYSLKIILSGNVINQLINGSNKADIPKTNLKSHVLNLDECL